MFCQRCGNQLHTDARFCAGCGHSVVGQQQNTFTTNPSSNNSFTPNSNANFRDLRKAARSQIKGNVAMVWVVWLCWAIVSSVLYFFTAGFISLIIPGVIEFGRVANQNAMFRGQPATLGGGFSGVNTRLLDSIVASFLVSIFTFLWFLLFIIPGIIKMYSYAMTFQVLQETPNKNALDCITESRRLMNGHKFRLFLYDLYFLFVGILFAVVTLFIGLLWWIPYYNQMRYNFYQSIKR